MELKNKKVLLVGLGILGGGLSMAKYLIKNGGILTITDLRDHESLKLMINKLPKNINFVLGKNPVSEIKKADIIILNPAVSAFSPIVREIKKQKKEYYNDYTFFLKKLEEKNKESKIIGITGTRGKTTTAMWANYLIDDSVLGGNIPDSGLLKILDKKTEDYVLELSSFQLEHITKKDRSPNISIITNIYVDHLNRYKTMERYSKMKRLIYANQNENDYLIVNLDEPSTKEILKDNPKPQIFFVSQKKLPLSKNGIFCIENDLFAKIGKDIKMVGNLKGFAQHEKNNFMLAAIAANLSGISWNIIMKKSKSLPQPKLRQEIIYDSLGIKIINDSAGTSPEATLAAIEKYKEKNIYLITGGTNKELQFDKLAKSVAKIIKPESLFLLSGSATNLLVEALPNSYIKSSKIREFDTLEEIIKNISKEIKKGVIIFSPGSASFEKFKNEFDRGDQFSKIIKKYFK